MPISIRSADPLLLCEAGIRWWLNELGRLTPARMLGWFSRDDTEAVKVEFVRDGISYEGRAGVTFGLCQGDGRKEGLLSIPEEAFYVQDTELPLVSIFRLAKLIEFEALRLNPLVGRAACFDYTVVSRNYKTKKLNAKIWFLKAHLLNQALQFAALSDKAICGIKVNCRRDLVVLRRLPGLSKTALFLSMRQMKVAQMSGLVGLLLLAAAATFVMKLMITEASLQKQEAELRAELGNGKSVIIAYKNLKEQFDTLNEALESAQTSAAISELTHVLPDSAWVTQLTISPADIRVQGYAVKASDIIAVLSNSRMFSAPRFVGPISKDGNFNAERFDVSAVMADHRLHP